MRRTLLLAGVALMAASGLPAHAASPRTKAPQANPKSIDDCERFKEALSYNACLASFGPMRRGGGAMVSPEVSSDGDSKASEGETKSAGSRYSRRDRRYSRSYRRHSGRTSATFSVPDSIISGNSLRQR